MTENESARRLTWVWNAVSGVIILLLAYWWLAQRSSGDAEAGYPTRPIQIVVPYGAGGGSDTFARILQKGLVAGGLIGQPTVIINAPGGSGTIGSREVKDAEPDGYKILCHHNAILTARLSGTVDYGPEAFAPIAMTGEMSMVILVRKDAAYDGIASLLQAAADRPKEIRFGANHGAPAYFTTLQLEREWPGAKFSIVSAGGGADRYAKIIGGHLDAGIFSLSEYLDFRRGGDAPSDEDIRAIAVLNESRHDSIPEVPTAREQGVNVLLQNANYWWAPKGTPAPIVDQLAAVLQDAMRDTVVLGELDRLRIDPTFDRGVSMLTRLESTRRQFAEVTTDTRARLPDFVRIAIALVIALAIAVAWESWREHGQRRSSAAESMQEDLLRERPDSADSMTSAENLAEGMAGQAGDRHRKLAAGSFVMVVAYVLVLASDRIPFAIATAALIVSLGMMLFRGKHGNRLMLLQLGLLTGLGMEFVFTELFTTALP